MRERVLGHCRTVGAAVVAVVAAVRVAGARARRRRPVQVDAVVQGLVGEVLVLGAARHVLLDGEPLGHQLLDLLGHVVLGDERRKVERRRRRVQRRGGRRRGQRVRLALVVGAIAQHWRHQAERGASAVRAGGTVEVGGGVAIVGVDGVAGQHVLELGPVLVQVGARRRDNLARQLGLERLLGNSDKMQ